MTSRSVASTTRSGRKERTAKASALVQHEFLHLIIDCERPLDGGARYALNGIERILFGRTERRGPMREERGTRLVFDLDSDIVSRSHAGLERTGSGWSIGDFKSKNGTFLNGQRVLGTSAVDAGDIIQIGGPVGGVFFTIGSVTVRAGSEPPGDILRSTDADERSLPGFPTLMPSLAGELVSLLPAVRAGAPIVIVGETGTGKELLAHAIHAASGRKGPFVPVNCAGLTANLVESQLFGYVKGAYSGAGAGNLGFIRAADGGTLFLDEVMDLPLPDQAKLLRVLQEREVVPLGASKAHRVDVRFVAASQKPLRDLAAAGRFREDLQNRLERRVVDLPPLRDRKVDLGMLAAALLRRCGLQEKEQVILPAEAVRRILAYGWPGNVRQFENKLGEAVDRIADGVLPVDVFPTETADAEEPPKRQELRRTTGKEKRALLEELLLKHDGNVSAVARELGTHREPVYRLLERAGLDAGAFRRR